MNEKILFIFYLKAAALGLISVKKRFCAKACSSRVCTIFENQACVYIFWLFSGVFCSSSIRFGGAIFNKLNMFFMLADRSLRISTRFI